MERNTTTNTNNIPTTLVTEDVTEFIFLLIESMSPNTTIGANPIRVIESIIDSYARRAYGVVSDEVRSMIAGNVEMASDIHRLVYERQVWVD